MSHLTSVTVHPSLANRRGRVGLIALWGVQVVLASLFFLAGSSKLTGAPAMVGLFDAIGVGQWLRYATGLVEVASAVALLVPSVAPFGAVALAATMLGAIATHLFIVGGYYKRFGRRGLDNADKRILNMTHLVNRNDFRTATRDVFFLFL